MCAKTYILNLAGVRIPQINGDIYGRVGIS